VNRQETETIITEYVKPVFGFALKRCKSTQDAEDLSQEIILKAYRALLVREDIADVGKFIWTIAHNALSNYYRDASKSMVGVSLDEVAELVADPNSLLIKEEERGSVEHLQSEIAYLSKLQRRIVIAYYFENRKQSEIAKELGIPVGTVKWHLFEAKKELKRGMDTMRKASELKFNPIKFQNFGINGSVGTKTAEDFFHSALAQNICYCVKWEAKTVAEIADALGVSPVYVENEVEFLEEYGFLQENKGKYLANFLMDETTTERMKLHSKMYQSAAKLFANDLYDELAASGLLEDEDVLCQQTDEPVLLEQKIEKDKNFLLWALIPYIAAWSGETLREERISFEEVATIRPDGAQNIFHATVQQENVEWPEEYREGFRFCGPMWNGVDGNILWQMDSNWSGRDTEQRFYHYAEEAVHALRLYHREQEEALSKDDYVWLAERGYVKTNGDYDGFFKSVWQIVVLRTPEIKEKLLAVGENLKKKYHAEFERLKAPYVAAELAAVPKHLKKMKEYELQFVFYSDGVFLWYCMRELVNNGKLKLPTEGQRKVLSTLMIEK